MNDTFLKACRGEKVPYTPVWLMRQAGRYMKEYQDLRAQVDFMTLCKTPELAAKVTMQPVDVLGVDAAILFSDILVVPEAMGMHIEFHEKKGPVLSEPIRNRSLADRLSVPVPEDELGFVMETIKILRGRLEGRVPLIGFSGAPFTLATYMIEGGSSKSFINTKKMMFQSATLFGDLMDKITASVLSYLRAQIKAGAQAVQLFDTWAGILTPEDFRAFELPYVKRIISGLRKEGVPIIYFVNDCAALLKDIRKSGADVIGVDWRIDMAEAVKKIGKKYAVQGNLDPCALFLPEEALRQRVGDILAKADTARGHIFNLGHGILPETPVQSVISMVRAVHEMSSA
jgi:uroporphyrinogen decarboxylase